MEHEKKYEQPQKRKSFTRVERERSYWPQTAFSVHCFSHMSLLLLFCVTSRRASTLKDAISLGDQAYLGLKPGSLVRADAPWVSRPSCLTYFRLLSFFAQGPIHSIDISNEPAHIEILSSTFHSIFVGGHSFFFCLRRHDLHTVPSSDDFNRLRFFCSVGWFSHFKDRFIRWVIFVFWPSRILQLFESLKKYSKFSPLFIFTKSRKVMMEVWKITSSISISPLAETWMRITPSFGRICRPLIQMNSKPYSKWIPTWTRIHCSSRKSTTMAFRPSSLMHHRETAHLTSACCLTDWRSHAEEQLHATTRNRAVVTATPFRAPMGLALAAPY